MATTTPKTTTAVKWCAIYTRQSVSEHLTSTNGTNGQLTIPQGFSSVDAQHEACEAFIKSRVGEGWKVYPERFDDEGLSGGNTDRPALQRLLGFIRQGKIQAIVIYKYDRLSRSIKDYARLLELFDKHGVVFVSVTQQFDTSTSIGRMMQVMLMGFAQFEREMISERTRDKRAATIQKGKWAGGMPVIGYDVDYTNKKLIVNRKEVKQARDQFLIYLKEKSLSRTARRLNELGYRMKAWITKKNQPRGGRRYNKGNLAQLLRNPIYLGKVRFKEQLFKSEHPAIVEETLFNRVQKLLSKNGEHNKSANQDKHDFLLRGFVRCTACNSMMSPNFAYSKGRKYFYYKCVKVNKLDKQECSVRSAPAKELEALVVKRLAFLGQHKPLVERIVKEAQTDSVKGLKPLREDRERAGTDLRKIKQEAQKLVGVLGLKGSAASKNQFILERLDELEQAKQAAEDRLAAIEVGIQRLESRQIDAEIIRTNLKRFTEVFEKLTPPERKDFLRLLLKEVLYNHQEGKIKLTLRQLPDLDLEVIDGKVSFDERTIWLPFVHSFRTWLTLPPWEREPALWGFYHPQESQRQQAGLSRANDLLVSGFRA